MHPAFLCCKNPAICGISALPEKHIREALAAFQNRKSAKKQEVQSQGTLAARFPA
jgi:hypothetical protein